MTLKTQHDKPVYVRLREVIADAILAGKYGDGDSLPSVRALAAEEQANPLTVAKAYQGFQDEGLMNHSSHTAVLDRQGTLVANIEGNEFTSKQLGDLVDTVLRR